MDTRVSSSSRAASALMGWYSGATSSAASTSSVSSVSGASGVSGALCAGGDAAAVASARKRSAASSAVMGPSRRRRSAAPSTPRNRRSGARRCNCRTVVSMTSRSSSSRSSARPSSSLSREGSRDRAAALRSARGESPSYRNWATYPNSRVRAKGEGVSVVVSTMRSLRPARSRCNCSSAGTSYTSCRHSRTVSRITGNCGYLRATSSNWAER